jgi:acyl-coenzyme A synthetase/AMP-(fatty) acid ligase
MQNALLVGVPSLWKAWLQSGISLAAVKTAVCAGAPLTLALEQACMKQHGLKLRNLYGTSETGAVALDLSSTLRPDATVVGQLLPGVRVEQHGGRLRIGSDAVGSGYDDDAANEEFGGGSHLTWDSGAVSEGVLSLGPCLGSAINVAGRKLSPREVAAKMKSILADRKFIVTGAPSRDPERCQEVVAQVDLPSTALTPEFKARACALLAPWEVPRRWIGLTDENLQ